MINIQVVELIVYGDFDIPMTDSIWYGSPLLEKPNLLKFYKNNNVEEARQYLVGLGYTCVPTFQFEIGGGL